MTCFKTGVTANQISSLLREIKTIATLPHRAIDRILAHMRNPETHITDNLSCLR